MFQKGIVLLVFMERLLQVQVVRRGARHMSCSQARLYVAAATRTWCCKSAVQCLWLCAS